MCLSGYQMQPMSFLHEMYSEILGASHTVSKSAPMSKSPSLMVSVLTVFQAGIQLCGEQVIKQGVCNLSIQYTMPQ